MSKKTGEEPKLSPLEGIKTKSNFLRGDIAEELRDENAFFGKDNIQLLKHHGSYQQDNRDERRDAKAAGVPGGKNFSLMIRTAIPGGKISSAQLLAELEISDEFGDKTLRITTRQGLQHHGILKQDAKVVIRKINAIDLTTLAACGDVRRNVMCSPAPFKQDGVHDAMQKLADDLAEQLKPQTSAYREIWLIDDETGEKEKISSSDSQDVEPLYGPTYLPRKFKLAVGLPGDNSADLYTQDCSFLAICEDLKIIGYNVLVGGGFGVTPSNKKTFAAVAQPLCFVTPDQAIDIAKAVIKVHRDFGNRSDRKIARLKYVIADWGIPKFKAQVEEFFGSALPGPKPVEVFGHDDGLGWREQGDGNWFYGLNVENGRIKDEGDYRLKTALREICNALAPPMILTPHQAIIFADITPENREKLEATLKTHGVPLTEETSTIRRWSMACPALPTCGLAVTESERALPGIIDQLEVELNRLGLQDEVFTTRMTGCPNGCARPYNSDIALVGKAKEKYTVFLGGGVLGNRLNYIYKDMVPADEVISTLTAVFEQFKENRTDDETFGDYCLRVKDALLA